MNLLIHACTAVGVILSVLWLGADAVPAEPVTGTFHVRMTIVPACAANLDRRVGATLKVNCSPRTPFQVRVRHGFGTAGTGFGMASANALSFEVGIATASTGPTSMLLTKPIEIDVRY